MVPTPDANSLELFTQIWDTLYLVYMYVYLYNGSGHSIKTDSHLKKYNPFQKFLDWTWLRSTVTFLKSCQTWRLFEPKLHVLSLVSTFCSLSCLQGTGIYEISLTFTN